MVRKRFAQSAFIVFGLVLLLYFPCYISDNLLAKMTEEDGPYENLSAFLLLLTAIIYAMLVLKPQWYHGHKKVGKYIERRYFIILMLIFFFAFGEEISWGQRIFNFDTPDVLKEANLQNEFNVHNLEVFHGLTRDGKKKTGLMAFFTMHRIYYMAFFTYLLVLPALNTRSEWVNTLVKKLRIPVPNVFLGLLFTFNLIYGDILRAINPSLENHGVVEIKETAIALILLVLSLSWIDFRKNFKIFP